MSPYLIIIFGAAMLIHGQASRIGDYHSGSEFPPKGRLTLTPHLSEEVISLDSLIRMSDLIADGTIINSLPPARRDANSPGSIETHSVVAIDKVISGSMPEGSGKILLVQQGGALGGWDVTVPSDPLVKSGERYILFLRRYNGGTHATYFAVGVWAGKARVDNSMISFSPNANPNLHAYDNQPVDTFLKTLENKISGRELPPMKSGVPFPGPGATAVRGTLQKP